MRVPVATIIALLAGLEIWGIIIFMKGFFPIKNSIPGHGTKNIPTEPQWQDSQSDNGYLPPLYDKLIIMLIDALRVDFVLPGTGSSLPKMKFVEDLILRNKTISFMAKAHPPTVTMPRIKALTTGGIPGFIDIILNLDSDHLSEDNLISQLRRHNRSVVFYGDDTWIKLFPGHFTRQEGTVSFFVTDYTEVDTNVTRHVTPELSRPDWSVMVLHYLGLDHIGHLAGPRSPLVPSKLAEMDAVVEQIYNHITEQYTSSGERSLLMLCGDHGMSDQGSHGGASASETATPLVYLTPDGTGLPYRGAWLEQIDVAPTLALALGLPVPQNSLGAVIVDVLRAHTPRDRLRAAYVNAQQLANVLRENIQDYEREPSYHQYLRARDSHISWLRAMTGDRAPGPETLDALCNRTLDLYVQALRAMRQRVAGTLAQYDLHAMGAGVVVAWMVVFALFILFPMMTPHSDLCLTSTTTLTYFLCVAMVTFTHVAVCTSASASDALCGPQVAVALPVLVTILVISAVMTATLQGALKTSLKYTRQLVRTCPLLAPLCAGCTLHTVSLLASSFVEEEHQTWYLLTVTMVMAYAALSWRDGTAERGQRDTGTEDLYHQRWEEQSTNSVRRRNKRKTDDHKNYSNSNDTNHSGPDGSRRLRRVLLCCVAVLLLCRVCRAWNQTGDKWAHLPDIGDWLVRPDNKLTLSCLTLTSVTLTCVLVYVRTTSVTSTLLYCGGVVGVYSFRAANGALGDPTGLYGGVVSKGVTEARIVFTIIFILIIHSFYKLIATHKTQNCTVEPSTGAEDPADNNQHRSLLSLRTFWSGIQAAWMLQTLLSLRPHNHTLATLVFCQEHLVTSAVTSGSRLSTPATVIVYYWMGQAGFFYQGNSNSLSSMDMSAGFIGLSDQNLTLASILMGAATYALPLYWGLSLVRVLTALREGSATNSLRPSLLQASIMLMVLRAVPVAVYVVLVTAQRYHLFVWSVFSPKLLYEGMTTVITAALVLVFLAQAAFL